MHKSWNINTQWSTWKDTQEKNKVSFIKLAKKLKTNSTEHKHDVGSHFAVSVQTKKWVHLLPSDFTFGMLFTELALYKRIYVPQSLL